MQPPSGTNEPQQPLRLLQCEGCGAPIPLADGTTTVCAACGTVVPIPETHRIARETSLREAAADELTKEAFRTLGKAPPWPLRMLSFFTPLWALLVNVMFLAVSTAIVTRIFDRAADFLAVNAYDYFSFPEQLLMTWGLAFAIVTLGLVLGAYGRREAIYLGSLQRALAAIPPSRLGGPATCRVCGAPLEVSNKAIAVRCPYCRSDNLVALDPHWVSRQQRGVEGVLGKAKEALSLHRKELRRLRLRLALSLGAVAILAVVIVGPILGGALRGGASVFALRRALKNRRELFDVAVKVVGYQSPPVARSFDADECERPHVVHDDELDCYDRQCWVGWFVALTHDETLKVTTNRKGRVELYEHTKDRTWAAAQTLAERWGTVVSEAPLTPATPATLRARRTSFYRVKLYVDRANTPLRLCAEISK